MKTQVIMKRELFGQEIQQQSKTEFFNATDLIRAGNIFRRNKGISVFNLTAYLNSKETKIFISALENNYGKPCILKGRGRSGVTWVHPLLFIDLALTIDPQLKIEVYQWLMDNLIKFRNESGDSYKKMAGALYFNCKNKSKFPKVIIKYAEKIKKACDVKDWQTATEIQLKLRDKIHENIALLSDVLKSNNQAVRIGIKKALNF